MVKDQHTESANKDLLLQRRMLWIALFIEIGSVVPVLAVAYLSKSLILFSDFYDYVYLILADVIALFVINNIIKGKTAAYDYGPGKIESLSALIISFITIVGLLVGVIFALRRFVHVEHLIIKFVVIGFCIHIVGLCVNIFMWRRMLAIARATDSSLMEVQWRLFRADAFGNMGVIASLSVAVLLRKFSWGVYVDPFCALIFLILSGSAFVKLMKDTLRDLSDKTLTEDFQMKILKRLTDHFHLYDSFHGVRSRRVGKKQYIEIILGFNPKRNLGDFFDLAGRIKETIASDIPGSEVSIVPRPVEEHEEPVAFRKIAKDIDIVPVTETMIDAAMTLCKETFPNEQDLVRMLLEESCKPGIHTAQLESCLIIRPRFWIAMRNGCLLGFSGMYFNPNDTDAVWGGWTAVDVSAGMASTRAVTLLLLKVLFESHKTGRKYIRLITDLIPQQARMKQIHENYGFTIFKTETDAHGCVSLYREAEIESLYKILNSRKMKHDIKRRNHEESDT